MKVQSKYESSIGYNIYIDETKVLQKHDEAFIHRGFYAKNFKATKTDFRKIKVQKYKGFIFCKKSYFGKNKKRLRRIAGQT